MKSNGKSYNESYDKSHNETHKERTTTRASSKVSAGFAISHLKRSLVFLIKSCSQAESDGALSLRSKDGA